MFTGLIETVGKISDLRTRGNYRVMKVSSGLPHDDVQIGESIACDGACLTVVSADDRSFVVEASQESIKRTVLSEYGIGRRINLERALQVGGRLGGHFVSGHIDTVGVVDYLKEVGESRELAIKHDSQFDRLVVRKGSIAVNGVSLTVNQCRTGWFAVNLIPLTIAETNLGKVKAGAKVNLEFDLLGKYILKMIEPDDSTGLNMNRLLESGW
jgi:riboflavin synthase